ncbi:inositol/phosphatidylinositol phosphatase [Coprinopsis cinerea okayama7|uniref:Inositol/phosphatidylinositol phosphatase n=1 Tax=Coprinopsis cinerea (strain Okayama-7 / 130 / ATCC MYA-4618 / FGSC 9003) TaxID=240176 RepID=A8N188_COPC7|nr:inositol/phosphatidylinositol phosphatase [Coprinopsis cinerea okayama7\|eukprot:XP_001828637.1 inositol/phosphatidylinositol phosphatase [Coprinopsis cinerea okayama7\
MIPLYHRLTLYSDNDTYIFVPEGTDARNLTVHRSSGDIVLNEPQTPLPASARRSGKTVYGIMGLISLSLSDYIIVITGRDLLSRLMGHDIYRATNFEVLPLRPGISVDQPPHVVETNFLSLLNSHLHSGNFLFSYDWDLTTRLQVQYHRAAESEGKALWELADDRFFWNRFLQTRFIDSATASSDPSAWASYILPVLYGTFDLRPMFLHGRHMQLCLISRRSRYRAGTRYFRRGIDNDGNVANYNETEQILLVEASAASAASANPESRYSSKFSFVQIRGSVPLFWSEINTLKYKPDLQIMEVPQTRDALRKHLDTQVNTYGPVKLVNLINQKGHEKPVKDAYERYMAELDRPDIQYQYFDFHAECRKMRWDRISVLIDKIKDDLEKQSYFACQVNDDVQVNDQTGVIRTNCMDNLDRTNVVQATIAKYMLNRQLVELGILAPGAGIDDYEAVSKDFREMWADHADAISAAYGGSGALKSDFTRTNKRTRKGMLEDGVKSVTRYLKNNFFDGTKQDAFDLVTGTWVPGKSPSASLFLVADRRPLIIRSMPAAAYFSLFMICAGMTLPRSSDYSLFYYFLLWFTVFTAAMTFILIHGIDYVAWPRLNPLTDIIYYNGPGFRSARNGMGWAGSHSQTGKKALWGSNGKVLTDEVELGGLKKRVD